jgi:hypothetical protein
MLEELHVRARASYFHGDNWSIPKGFEARELPVSCQQRFNNKDPVMCAEANPGVSLAVSARDTCNKTCVGAETQELLPRP